jgi:glycosyltransferase involved in cell wall biosynthesis
VGILFVNTKSVITPIQRVHAAIAANLDEGRFKAFVVSPRGCEGEAAWDDSPKVTVWRRQLGTSLSAHSGRARVLAVFRNASLLRDLPELAIKIRVHRIRVIHTGTTTRDVLAGIVLSAMTRTQLVIHWHDTFWGSYPLLWKIGFRRARRIFSVSEASKRSLVEVGVPAEKFVVIHNGIDVDRFRPQPPSAAVREELDLGATVPVILMAGRLCPGKGQAELLQAMALLRDRGLRPTALVVGEDDPMSTPGGESHRAHLEALANDLGIEAQVRFCGARNDMLDLMATADVVTVPSWAEPCALVILEAMAAGRPLLGTTSGGTPELIDDGVDGLLVPPREPVALANALERLLRDEALRAALGRRARQEAETRFATRHMVAEAEDAYLELARAGASALGPSSHLRTTRVQRRAVEKGGRQP